MINVKENLFDNLNMAKIGKIIDKCNDCEWCYFLKEEDGNTVYAAICLNENGFDKLLSFGCSSQKRVTLAIPKDCPLEEYKKDSI